VSFRTGARFGPYGIKSGSRRQRTERGYHAELGVNPYGLRIFDCGDVPCRFPIFPRLSSTFHLSSHTNFLLPIGASESGGWSAREVKRISRGFSGLNIVAVDVVEVSPPYDTNAELTSVLAADLIHEFLSVLVRDDGNYAKGLKSGSIKNEQEKSAVVSERRDEL
jgi:arginase family enzyme